MKILKILCLSLLVAFTSCKDDDDTPPTGNTSGNLVATWIATDYSYEGTTTSETMGISVTSTFVGTASELDLELTFNEDNTYETNGSYTLNLVTTFEGQTIEQDVPFNVSSSGTYELDGNMLTITGQGATSEATILELTENTLRYTATAETTQTVGQTTATTIITETTVLTRQ